MSAETVENSSDVRKSSERSSFFRQSGWLMIAGTAGGLMMYGAHFFSKVIPEKEYAIFGALLALTICVPAMPLQMVFAQQTAAALAMGRQRQLAAMFRASWAGITGLWIIALIVMLFVQKGLMDKWDITNSWALWVTMLVILMQAWLPLFQGLLQGEQKFMPFGWAMMLNGVGRVIIGVLVVIVLAQKDATGIMIGAFGGFALATGICMWASRDVWTLKGEPYDLRGLLSQVIPLLLGFGACQFLMAADTMIVKAYLKENSQCYVAAGTLARALVWAIGPLTAVMFPRIVHSSVRGEKSNVFGLSLVLTAALALAGVLGFWLFGPFVVRLMTKPSYVEVTMQILPWYAVAMVPLCLANLLASNLLGKGQYRVVIPMITLAIGYGVTLMFVHGSFIQVLQLLGLFNFLLFAVCAWFTWGAPQRKTAQR
jgi:O-antigen/teichoic acid export membrane protein